MCIRDRVSAVDGVFSAMLCDPVEMGIWMALTVLAGFLVCSFGIQKGLERISKWMMAALLLLIVVLAVNSVSLDGAIEGVKFYLLPDFERAAQVGLGNVATAAMNQSFFTLSLGIAEMCIRDSGVFRIGLISKHCEAEANKHIPPGLYRRLCFFRARPLCLYFHFTFTTLPL